MSTRKKSKNFVQRLLKQIWRFFDVATKAIVNWLLRSLFLSKRQSRQSRAGFVLPTVVMVILVVTLLTTAIMIRSFDRSKNASNVRVDQVVLNAARPAIDRARAKIDRLFSLDETKLGNTPPENDIAELLSEGKYRFGDEEQIELTGQFDQAPEVADARKLNSAWRFPVDTDNNGKFDTFTLYGIYFRNPQTKNNNENNRPRGTTEARALPQDDGQADNCGSGSSPTAGWYSIGGQLKKAFFTYVANVPITDTTGLEPAKYETYKGNKGFSALEMQIDQTGISLDNNAVWYQDDIALSAIPSLRLNGRVHTNSNLLVRNDAPITFLQVSSVNSCFYNPDNAKIVVGGNVAAGDIGEPASGNNAVTVDLFAGKRILPPPNGTPINSTNQTTTETPTNVAGNSDAYAQRLGVLVQTAIELHDTQNVSDAGAPTVASVSGMAPTYPEEVVENFKTKMADSTPGSSINVLKRTLESYFADRIRRVSFAEVASDAAAGTATAAFTTFGPELQPPAAWTLLANTNLSLNMTGPGGMQMPASKPEGVTSNQPENVIGDRVLVGNNLPRRWLKGGTFSEENEAQPIPGATWVGGEPRERKPVVELLDDLGDTSRNGFWETAAAKKLTASGPTPGTTPDAELSGGLRIVTGAGIYIDQTPLPDGTGARLQGQTPNASTRSFLPPPSLSSEVDTSTLPKGPSGFFPDYTVVWPDTMPMYRWKGGTVARTPGVAQPIGMAPYEQLKGDLQMRATVVYHYANGEAPLACVSSYYDPTDPFTADNANGISNNGISYLPQASADVSQLARLQKQAKMVFPDGRWVNKPLYYALKKSPADLSFADKSAIDAANCALSILDGAVPAPGIVPDGAIKERAFLDARQIKAIHRINTERDNTTPVPNLETSIEDLGNPDHLKVAPLGGLVLDATTNQPLPYNLPLEQRQPLEVRVTEIDLDLLRTTQVVGGTSGQEYLLPNSGIIYATRDDALPDISCGNVIADINKAKTEPSFSCSNAGTDFELDPTRRPNGIRLINGQNLEREQEYRAEEKGLIVASDLPVYIKGDFNLHLESGTTTPLEEFKEAATIANFYDRETPEDRFACRRGSPSCSGTVTVGNGDQWRAARILSDAITILSDNFRDGYRYEGDYDVSNNAGNVAVESFLKNGFWNNSYAASANWYGANGLPRTDFADPDATGVTASSSYVTNSVTPIQRRVNNFPVYQMEICKKLPASECRPQNDWTPLGDTSTTVAQDLPTTPPPSPLETEVAKYEREHYPRRVVFERDDTGQLVLENGHAKPVKADGTAISYPAIAADATAVAAGLDRTRNNVLWYATTTDNTDPSPKIPDPSAGIGYTPNNLLYYAPDESETPTAVTPILHERQLLLPGTPAFPEELYEAYPAFKGTTNQTVLNGATPNDPSDFAVCTSEVSSKEYKTPAGASDPDCSASSRSLALQMLSDLRKLGNPTGKQLPVLALTRTLNGARTQLLASANKKVNVFDLTGGSPNGQLANLTLTIRGNNQPDPIFIFRSTARIGMRFEKVQLQLEGVDPNNIFWVPRFGGIRIAGAANTSTLTGNFIGEGILIIEDATNVNGGRFLGFGATRIRNGELTALTTTAQPLLVPVLNLHSPTGTPGAANNGELSTNWLPQATDTKVNAVLVMGDSPSRPLPFTSDNAEYNGGLANFPRFLEDWQQDTAPNAPSKITTKISGGFIQFKRSAVATAPFETITDSAQDIALFFDDPGYPQALSTFSAVGFKYNGGASAQKAAYYKPPDRQWGYDVGLLSQTPDLYSRRFTSPQAQSPNEYFREVSRDDGWVNTLLCGKVVGAGGVATDPALPPAQRPTNCPT